MSAGSCAGWQQCANTTQHTRYSITALCMSGLQRLTLPYVILSTPHTGAYWALQMQHGQGHLPQHWAATPAGGGMSWLTASKSAAGGQCGVVPADMLLPLVYMPDG